ncbi:MAG: class I SAM-dependent methyltransferase [Verrucomicrobia bacterium]|nr:class I SAM-dependent methyltransferase [Verrucomicrobiota bacterium]MBS0636693.1 class I SAM-dependent methyltransferase [Verrucomicrobiota bacterium]
MNPISSYRAVFQTTQEAKNEFVDFLRTIFYRLDEKKVLKAMEEILEDPTKTDEMVYNELVARMSSLEKPLGPVHQIRSLSVLQKGMGKQAAELTRNFDKGQFHDYLEVYFRRYLATTRKTAQMPFDGKIYGVCDASSTGSFTEKLESGGLASKYQYVPLNDADCQNPELQPEKTHKPIGDEVADNSLDMISCLGGLHHIPKERQDAFVASMHKKLRPGAVLLLRDHNVTNTKLAAMVSVVHSFVNAANKTPWAVESKEVRDFQSLDHWKKLLEKHKFVQVTPEQLVLKDDPTQNAMMAFVKAPENLEELRQAAHYRSDCVRPQDGTRATWIEWGNVRYSKQYAEFVQNHHSYDFDYIGHLRQHWRYVYEYIKESKRANCFKPFSDNMAMNVFILFSATVQCAVGYISSLPSRLFAKIFPNKNLTALEKAQAAIEREYSNYIDHTPFYMFPWVSKMKTLWSAIKNSNEGPLTKITSVLSAAVSSLSMLVTAAISAPIRALYTTNGGYVEPDTIKVLVKDSQDEFKEAVYQTPDKYKIVSLKRYRDFTEFCKTLPEKSFDLLEIGSQKEVTVDVLLDPATPTPQVARVVYELDKLQDEHARRYVTYQVDVVALKAFVKAVGAQNIEYVHE